MSPNNLISRTAVSWRLAFMHGAQAFHYLMRALLLSLASVGFALTWLCCSLDRFRSSKNPTAWIISPFPKASSQPVPEPPRPIVLEERNQPCTPEMVQVHPRTIDSLLRGRGMRA